MVFYHSPSIIAPHSALYKPLSFDGLAERFSCYCLEKLRSIRNQSFSFYHFDILSIRLVILFCFLNPLQP